VCALSGMEGFERVKEIYKLCKNLPSYPYLRPFSSKNFHQRFITMKFSGEEFEVYFSMEYRSLEREIFGFVFV
jgi:hypothetical protein